MIVPSVATLKLFLLESEIFSLHKAKKKVFVESLDQFQRLEVRKKEINVFVMSLHLSDHKVLHNLASVLFKFFRFCLDLLPCISYFLNFWSLRNLIKQYYSICACWK